jgi:hypothetical protein
LILRDTRETIKQLLFIRTVMPRTNRVCEEDSLLGSFAVRNLVRGAADAQRCYSLILGMVPKKKESLELDLSTGSGRKAETYTRVCKSCEL